MTEHAAEIIPLLLWMVVVVGAALVGLIVWIGKRLHAKVDELPDMVSVKVKSVHDEILRQMEAMNSTQKDLERDLRTGLAAMDRRVIALEVRCDLTHPHAAKGFLGSGHVAP